MVQQEKLTDKAQIREQDRVGVRHREIRQTIKVLENHLIPSIHEARTILDEQKQEAGSESPYSG